MVSEIYERYRDQFPVTESYYRRCLSLPLHPGMSDEDVDRVAATVWSLMS